MISAEILQKIKEIEIHTRKAIAGTQVGRRVTKKAGAGFEFDQIRLYQFGDDIRCIDWKNFAKTGTLYVKQYLEERNRTCMICVDISSSLLFSSTKNLKSEVIQNVASVLALVAQSGGDKVGLILYADSVETVIPAGAGRAHVQRILEALFQVSYVDKKTKSLAVCDYLLQNLKKTVVCFFVTDGIDDYSDLRFKVLAHKHEVIMVRCLDAFEHALPSASVWMQDPESKTYFLYTPGSSLNALLKDRIAEQDQQLKKAGIYLLTLQSDSDFIRSIINFFRIQMMY